MRQSAAARSNGSEADRKARNSERHTLISKLDALAARVRLTRRGSPQRTAMQAQEARVQKQLHDLLQKREDARARQREQQRWQRELGGGRALFNTIRPDKVINLPLDTLRVPTHVDENGEQQYRTARGQCEVAEAATENWEGLFNQEWWQSRAAAKELIDPMRDDAACHLSAAQAAILLPENMFTPKRMSEAMDAIRKGTMPGESGISVDLITHKAWPKEMSEHLPKWILKPAHADGHHLHPL
jgi:hypothetical protein